MYEYGMETCPPALPPPPLCSSVVLLLTLFRQDRFSTQDVHPSELDCSLNISPLWSDLLVLN